MNPGDTMEIDFMMLNSTGYYYALFSMSISLEWQFISVTHCAGQIALEIWVNIAARNSLLPRYK